MNAMKTLTATTAAALAAAALTLGPAGTAHAELYGLDDPQDTFHGSDLRAVSIRNGDAKLRVVTTHENLRRDPRTGSGGAVFISTDPDDPGPEYVFVGGFTSGTDYQLVHTEGFAADKWGGPVTQGYHEMEVNYRRDRVHFVMTRAAIGGADDVRIAVRVGGSRTDGTSHGLTDWLSGPRVFTRWIAKG